MGLRCLIGHEFGPPETARERDERDGDVVVTIREYKECQRCGHQHVISENKEVRAGGRPDPEAAATDSGVEADHEPVPEAEEFRDVSAEEDDGVILEDEPEEAAGRGHGEWPEAPAAAGDGGDDEEAESGGEWPNVEGDDEGYDAGPSAGGPEGVTFRGSSLTPEPDPSRGTAGGDDGAEILEDSASPSGGGGGPSGAGRPSGEAASAPTASPQLADDELELACPACGHVTPAMGGSLRSGDICPECRRGYLAERPSE